MLQYCPTGEMLADILTKAKGRELFEKLRDGIGIKFQPDDLQKKKGS